MLYFLYPLFKLLCHYIGVSAFQHHGDSSYTFAFTVHCHSSEALGSAKPDDSYVTDMYRNPVSVGYHNLFDVFDIGNHTFRTDIVGVLHFFNVTSACILVVAAEGFEYFTNGDIQ